MSTDQYRAVRVRFVSRWPLLRSGIGGTALDQFDDLVALLSGADPLGAAITARSTEHGNRATLR